MRFSEPCRLFVLLCGFGVADSSHITSCFDCPPTASPAPTESPAPSPSPSEAPTMLPSVSSEPTLSFSPTEFPSPAPTDQPTSTPTHSPSAAPTLHHSNFPTESPAPSPSPSEAPTMLPSVSSEPTLSFSPTEFPSTSPTDMPSISQQPSISMKPSISAVFLISSDNEIMLEGFDTLLDPEAKDDFEEVTLAYLSGGFSLVSGETEVTFESVRITDQFLHDDSSRRRLSGGSLHVVCDVAAFVRFHGGESFNYSEFVSSIFKDEGNFEVLHSRLSASSSYFGNGTTTKSETPLAKKNSSIIFSCVGLAFVAVGFAAMFRLRSGGRVSLEDGFGLSLKPTESCDSASSGNNEEEESEISYPSTGYPISKQFNVKTNLRSADLEKQNRLYSSESFDSDPRQHMPHNMYQPAMLQTESNIEIPVTPMTNYDASHFSPKGIGPDDEVDLWARPSSPEDDDCRSDVELCAKKPPTVPRRTSGIFGFGGKRKRTAVESSAIVDEKIRSHATSALSSESNDANLNYSYSPSAPSSSTFSSFFSGPTKLLKTAWQTSGPSADENNFLGRPKLTPIDDPCTGNQNDWDIEQSDIPAFESNAKTIEVMNEVSYLRSRDKKSSEISRTP